jgi:hypothetical protein
MAKANITITNGRALTFLERLDTLRAANAEAHYEAALKARSGFEERLVAMVNARVHQVLDAVVGD